MGGGLLLPDLRVSGSGCRLLPDPFRRLSVPPLAGLEGQGCGDLACRGAAAGLLSALPRHSSCSIVPIPMPYSSPISITGAALEKVSLVLVAKDALELAPPFSRLLQPSVSSVVDLGVMAFGHHPLPSHSLCGRVTHSDGVHSVCAPVSTSGGLDGLLRSQGSVSSSAGSSCFSSLSSLLVT